MNGAYDTSLSKAIYDEDESACIYLWNHVLPKWSKWHRERKYKTYEEHKRFSYNEYVQRNLENNALIVYEQYENVDWEAEFCMGLAERIENKLREKYERVN